MKRLLFLAALFTLIAFAAGIMTYSPVMAGHHNATIICHHNPDMDGDPPDEWFLIGVNVRAAGAHIGHGDCFDEGNVGDACDPCD